jgi:SOS-response transcriptional repressor LexA
MAVTQLQRGLLVQVAALYDEQGYPPTISELVRVTGRSRAATHVMLERLREQGCVTWVERKPRTLMVTQKGWGVLDAKPGAG